MSDRILRVQVVKGGGVTDTQVFDEPKVKVGTLPTTQLCLDDPSVTSIHAVIEDQGDGTYMVIDLGSARGTYINGSKVTKGTAGDGDELKFGDVLVRLDVTDRATLEVERQAAEAAAAAAAIPEGHIVLEDGSTVEPFTMEGYYDDDGNYIPGYYDEDGTYHYGYGFHDENGEWKVAHGFYDPDGEWVPTVGPDGEERPSDKEVYTENFFQGDSGDVLEVAFLWTDYVLDVQAHQKPKTITIGGGEGNDYVLEDAVVPVPSFPLISYDEGMGYRLNFLPQMTGMIQRSGEQYTLSEAAALGGSSAGMVPGAQSVPLTAGMSARLEFGPNTFLIRFTTPPVLAGAMFGVEKAPLFYQAVSLGLHVAFMLLVFTLPDGFGRLELHDFRADDRFVELLTPPEQEEEEELDWMDAPEETAAHQGDEGEAGDEDEIEEDMQMAIEGDADPDDVELQRQYDEEVAMDAGALAVFSEMGSPFSDASQTIGADAMMAMGNLEGAEQGAARGLGGLGLAGTGRGGGGVSESGFGRAQVGGGGLGGPGGRGGQGVDIGEREVREPQLNLAPPEVEGYLDREIIQRIVRQHRREMIHCYETELQRNPNLAGRVVMTWVISGNGSVVSASVSETTLNNATVESCMAQRIRRWVFPEPTGGGIVRVNYPFNFSS